MRVFSNRKAEVSMKKLIVALVALGLAGCPSACPKPIADGIAQLTSNTHELADRHRGLIMEAPLTSGTLHDLALIKENERLADSLNDWAELNRSK